MSSYSSFILNEWSWNHYFKREPIAVKDQTGTRPGLSGYEANCDFCHNEFKMGDRIRMHEYPYWFMHFDCWKTKVTQDKKHHQELAEQHRNERQQRRERLRLQNNDPSGSFRLSANFLKGFGQTHGFFMGCAICKRRFHPGSLVTTAKVDGNRRVIHYVCGHELAGSKFIKE